MIRVVFQLPPGVSVKTVKRVKRGARVTQGECEVAGVSRRETPRETFTGFTVKQRGAA